MTNLAFASIREIKEKIYKKELSSKEVLKFFLDRFEKYDDKIGSAIEIFDQESIESVSNKSGLLHGIPGILKDNICQKNRKLSCGSKILENYRSPYDSTAASRLKNYAAPIIGRSNLDEFAMGSSTEYSYYKKTRNPFDLNKVPGGSSGGSAAAVAAGLVPWALGSETGGSVRQPAALCGIYGLKPTYGLISRYGLVAYASSLDQIGIFTRNVYDNAIILSALSGKDDKDSTSLNIDSQDYTKDIDKLENSSITIAVLENALEIDGIDKEVYNLCNNAIKVFEKLKFKIKRIKLPIMDYSAATYFVISRAEAASNLARFDGIKYGFRSENNQNLTELYNKTREEGFGFEVRSRILVGNYVLSSGHTQELYANAILGRNLIRSQFIKAFEDVDLIFSPVTPSTAFEFGKFNEDNLFLDLQDYFTCSVNLAGIPAFAIPCGLSSNNMPVGFQLIGPDLSEKKIYQVAYAYEKEINNIFIPKDFK